MQGPHNCTRKIRCCRLREDAAEALLSVFKDGRILEAMAIRRDMMCMPEQVVRTDTAYCICTWRGVTYAVRDVACLLAILVNPKVPDLHSSVQRYEPRSATFPDNAVPWHHAGRAVPC